MDLELAKRPIADPSEKTAALLFEDQDSVIWVDWREEDEGLFGNAGSQGTQRMSREYTQAEADAHNALTQKGWEILDDYILLAGREPVRVGFFAKRRLKKALGFFMDAQRIAPENFSSKYALGKIYQVIGDQRQALRWFEEACAVEKDNADVFREAGLAAMDCAEFSKALRFADSAIELEPADAGLHCNRALNLMFLNRDAEALEALGTSLELKPGDQVTENVQAIVQAVADGNRPRPRTTREL